jgi:SAM-dependent methyltransferase
MLAEANVVIPLTEEELDPLRVEINMVELRKLLSWLYRDTNATGSEAFAFMRRNMPILYDGHSIDTAKTASQKDREASAVADECYAYGEVDYETFATLFMKICAGYGTCLGDFVDLGCGVGTLVYAAACLGNFTRCVGIDRVKAVLDRGKKRMARWERAKDDYPVHVQTVEFDWLNTNFLEDTNWTSYANFIFLHWTALSNPQIRQTTELLTQCAKGTICVTLTNPIMDEVTTGYEVLEQGHCDTSWGRATFYVYEKMN